MFYLKPSQRQFPPSMDFIFSLSLTLFCSLLHFSAPSFTPTDNYLINCGSTSNTSLYNRIFTPDASSKSVSLSKDNSISLTNHNPSSNSPFLYDTARVFTSEFSYKFDIKNNGTHLVRFHFSPFASQGFDLTSSTAKFSVFVNGLSTLKDFNTQVVVLREFIVKVESGVLEILFRPVSGSSFGFINAIEVFSAPNDFILDVGTRLISDNGDVGEYRNLSSQVLETIHRINVGGSKLTPFNDTLWRTWIPDDDFLVLKSAAKRVVTTHTPNYQKGGSTQEIAPDNVYMTAQEMNRDNQTIGARFNISWDFFVGLSSVRHLIRLHFCDFVSPALNQLYFNVFINDYSAYENVDLSVMTVHVLSSPIYIDFVAKSDDSGVIHVSVGPSVLSTPSNINAILNGVEIMRLVNVAGTAGSETGTRKKWIERKSVV